MTLTDLLVLHSSPTLAGLKSASLISLEALTARTAFPRKALEEKGLCFCTLRNNASSVLLLVYRQAILTRVLASHEAREVLEPLGYDCGNLTACLSMLQRRFSQSCFPHEVGIFLGYPADDVKGFISNGGKNYRFSGLWKVYGNEEKARKLLALWTKCRDVYWSAYRKGTAIEKLCITA